MSISISAEDYKSLKTYNEKLGAENKAKTNEIDVLNKQIDRLNKKSFASSAVNQNTECKKCEEKDRRILELERNLKSMTQIRMEEKNQYEFKTKNYSQRNNSQKSNNLSEFQREQNNKIEHLEGNLREAQTELRRLIQAQKDNIKALQAHENQHGNRVSSQYPHSYGSQSNYQLDKLRQQLISVKKINEDLQSKYDSVSRRASEWTNNGFSNDKSSKHDNSQIMKENEGLLSRIQFVQKRLIQVEDWNRILRQQVLMKMSSHSHEVPNKEHLRGEIPNLFNQIQSNSHPNTAIVENSSEQQYTQNPSSSASNNGQTSYNYYYNNNNQSNQSIKSNQSNPGVRLQNDSEKKNTKIFKYEGAQPSYNQSITSPQAPKNTSLQKENSKSDSASGSMGGFISSLFKTKQKK